MGNGLLEGKWAQSMLSIICHRRLYILGCPSFISTIYMYTSMGNCYTTCIPMCHIPFSMYSTNSRDKILIMNSSLFEVYMVYCTWTLFNPQEIQNPALFSKLANRDLRSLRARVLSHERFIPWHVLRYCPKTSFGAEGNDRVRMKMPVSYKRLIQQQGMPCFFSPKSNQVNSINLLTPSLLQVQFHFQSLQCQLGPLYLLF